MSYVVIIETAATSDRVLPINVPPDYPLSCQEFDTLPAAASAHPGKTVMATEDFNAWMNLLATAYPMPKPQLPALEVKKSWWAKFCDWLVR